MAQGHGAVIRALHEIVLEYCALGKTNKLSTEAHDVCMWVDIPDTG